MKIKVLLVVLLMALAAQDGVCRDSEYKVKRIENDAFVTYLEYYSFRETYDQTKKSAELEMLSEQQVKEKLSAVPVGGVIATCFAITPPDKWTCIIVDLSGRELFRANGKAPKEEEKPAYEVVRNIYGTPKLVPSIKYYHEKFDISVALPDSFKVYTVDTVKSLRSGYLITKKIK